MDQREFVLLEKQFSDTSCKTQLCTCDTYSGWDVQPFMVIQVIHSFEFRIFEYANLMFLFHEDAEHCMGLPVGGTLVVTPQGLYALTVISLAFLPCYKKVR